MIDRMGQNQIMTAHTACSASVAQPPKPPPCEHALFGLAARIRRLCACRWLFASPIARPVPSERPLKNDSQMTNDKIRRKW
jgi:hypothetical protein